MASITPRLRADGTPSWRVQFRVDGRMRQETFLDPRGAEEFGRLVDRVGGDAARRVLDARREKPEDMPTLREWALEYLEPSSGLLTGVEDATRTDYRRILDTHIAPVLGDLPLDAIARDDIGRWVHWQESRSPDSKTNPGRKLAAKSIANHHAFLSQLLASAVEAGHIARNVAYKTKLSKEQRHEPVFLSREEFSTLLHFVPEEHRRFVLFLAGTGARWGEATALTWGDLNLDHEPATVRINKAWKKTQGAPLIKHPKTSRSNRTVSLYADLVHALGDVGELPDLIFPARRGGKMWPGRFNDSVWAPATAAALDRERCAELGLVPLRKRPRVHDLRHSHASWLVAAGAPLPYVQARLGHESITTTINVYGHLLPDAHVQMSAMIADTLAGAVQPTLALSR